MWNDFDLSYPQSYFALVNEFNLIVKYCNLISPFKINVFVLPKLLSYMSIELINLYALKSNVVNDRWLHLLLGISIDVVVVIDSDVKYEQVDNPDGADRFSTIERNL